MKIKRLYTPPQSGALEVKPQGMLCTSASDFYYFLDSGGLSGERNNYTTTGSGDEEIW